MDRYELGRRGEEAAATYLSARGHTIVERNWRCSIGEIDIISLDGETIVFTEVKTRRGSATGTPEEAVGPLKRRRLALLARAYLHRHRLDETETRIDVIAIQVYGDRARLRLVQDAVGE